MCKEILTVSVLFGGDKGRGSDAIMRETRPSRYLILVRSSRSSLLQIRQKRYSSLRSISLLLACLDMKNAVCAIWSAC